MKPVFIHREAEEEATAAATFYNERVRGLGLDFTGEFEAAVDAIEVAPHLWPRRKYGTRRYLLHRFPYAVVYLELPKQIWVVAVAHGSRKPYYWSDRLKDISREQ